MMFSSPFRGFLLLGLWMSASQADISLKLRNKQYLPPTVQQSPIKEDHYNPQDNTQQQQKVADNNYVNDRYQTFQVHNRYEHTKRNGENNQKSPDTQINLANNNYSPLRKISAEKLRIEHFNTPAGFSLDDPSLDVSYLSFAKGNDGSNQHILVQHESTKSNIPSKFKQNFNAMQQSFSQLAANHFMAPDYLPPKMQTQKYTAPGHQTVEEPRYKSIVNSPDYSSQKININNVASFKGPDYLPPQQYESSESQQNSLFKGPDYLPPRKLFSEHSPNSYVSHAVFKGPDYLPPHQFVSSQSQENIEQRTAFKGPSYLPPQQHGSDQSKQSFMTKSQFKDEQFRPSVPFNGIDYSPIEITQTRSESSESVKDPDYFLSFQSQNNAAFKGTGYLTPLSNHIQVYQQQIQSLPLGYDFQKPANAEQAIEELHKLPEETPKSETNLSEREESSNIVVYDTPKETESVLKNGILQTGYGFQKPSNSIQFKKLLQRQETTTSIQSLEDSEHSLPAYHFHSSDNTEHGVNQLHNTESSQQYFQSETGQQDSYDKSHTSHVSDTRQSSQSETHQNFKYSTLQQTQVKQSNQNHQSETYQAADQNSELQPKNQREAKQISESSLQTFKGPEYLPPTTTSQTFKGAEYSSHTTASQTFKDPNNSHGSDVFKGPSYLPPSTDSQNYKGPDYLPPSTASQTFKGSEYLPPTTTSQTFKGAEYSSHTTASQTFKDPNNSHGSDVFKGPSYLPPSTDSQNYKGPDYLPPSTASQTFKGSEYLPPTTTSETFKGAEYSSDTTASQTFKDPNNSHGSEVFKGPSYLPPSTDSQNYKGHDYLPPSTASQTLKGSVYLPPTTTSQTFKGAEYSSYTTASQTFKDPNNSHGSEVFKGPSYLPPSTNSQNYKGPDYLPPVDSKETPVSSRSQQTSHVFKGPDYLPPVSDEPFHQALQQSQFRGPDYLPPTVYTTTQGRKPIIMYPLSSYMKSVNPYDRYGNTRRFPEYVLSPIKISNEVSPIYREPSSRPQYYAPAYSNSPFSNYNSTMFSQTLHQTTPTISQQLQQALPTFVPEDIQKETPTVLPSTTLPTAKAANAKIRTVKILNNNDVKTLKVLESLDHAGIKTIKILGSTNEPPMGNYRVVKVVSGSNEQTVQTIQIFSGHQDVTSNGNVAGAAGQSKSYLPPRNKHNSNNKTKIKERQHI